MTAPSDESLRETHRVVRHSPGDGAIADHRLRGSGYKGGERKRQGTAHERGSLLSSPESPAQGPCRGEGFAASPATFLGVVTLV